MRVGVDLDNTIICYDRVLARVATEKGLISGEATCLPSKHGVKSEVERRHGSEAWTALQGELYGSRLPEAEPFPGVVEFFRRCRDRGISTYIISHKTEYPVLGPRYNLRRGALAWLEAHGWFDSEGIGLSRSHVEFHDALPDKLEAIGRRGCELFVDDLPEVLTAPTFPEHTCRVLFDPSCSHNVPSGVERVTSWDQIADRIVRAPY